VLSRQGGAADNSLDGAVLGDHAFVLRYFSDDHGDRLIVVNLGVGLTLHPAPEPLLAPPSGRQWKTLWSSECVEYGGYGTPPLDEEGQGFRLPAQCTVLLGAMAAE
jgi:maltooligosyltrehalose trehalohydrolase